MIRTQCEDACSHSHGSGAFAAVESGLRPDGPIDNRSAGRQPAPQGYSCWYAHDTFRVGVHWILAGSTEAADFEGSSPGAVAYYGRQRRLVCADPYCSARAHRGTGEVDGWAWESLRRSDCE